MCDVRVRSPGVFHWRDRCVCVRHRVPALVPLCAWVKKKKNNVHSLPLCLSTWEIAGPRSHLLQSNIVCPRSHSLHLYIYFTFCTSDYTVMKRTHTTNPAHTPPLVYCAGGVNTFYDGH